jgi:hypothetical protein
MHSKTLSLRPLLATFCAVVGLIEVANGQSSPRLFSEVHVIRSMRQLHSAQATYQATAGAGNFGSLQNLLQAGFIDEALASGAKYGYVYVVSTVPFVPGQSPASFTVTATPRAYRKSGRRSFYIDPAGEIHGGDKSGLVATSSDPYIDDCTSGSIPDNERCTIEDMRALHGAQSTYSATVGNGNYGTFTQLHQAGLIRTDLADSVARGYLYVVEVIDLVPNTQPPSFKIWATPQTYGTTAVRSIFIDQTGVLRGADHGGQPAGPNDPPINE